MDTGFVMKYLHALRISMTYRIVLFVLSAAGVVYLLLFSPPGNRILAPAIEKALSSALSTPVVIDDFTLTHNRFELLIQDEERNALSLQGGFSLITLRLYAHYRIDAPRAGGINPARTPFRAEGLLNGGIAAFDIRGTLRALGGEALYPVQLHRFKPATLHAELNRLSYEELLCFMDYPSSTDTRLSGVIDLRGFDRRNVTGYIRLNADTGRFEPTPILEQDDNASFDLLSLLADSRGRIKPFDLNVTLDASLNHAGILEQFAGLHLSGPATLSATLVGNHERLLLDATGKAARSDLSLTLDILKLHPEQLRFRIEHADIEHLFQLFSLPAPMSGRADASGNFMPQWGNLTLSLSDAKTHPAVLRSDYNLTQPPLSFDAELSADFDGKGVRYRGGFVSDLQRLDFNGSAPHDEMLRELLKTFR